MRMNEEVLSSAVSTGLSDSEAQERLAREGYNELPRSERRTAFRIVLEVLRERMLALLLAAGAVYFALGDLQEAVILVVFASLSIVITVVQEARTERVLEALRDLTSPRALVIRDGLRKRWCAAISSYLPKATACRRMPFCCRRRICRPMNRC